MNHIAPIWRLQLLIRARFTTVRFFFSDMTCNGHIRDSYDYTHLLQQCRSVKSLKEIHAQIITGGYEQHQFVATKIIGKYMDFGSSRIVDARKVFDKVPDRDVFLWNMVIQGYAKNGPFEEALNSFDQMQVAGMAANRFTFTFVLKACGGMKDIKKGQVIHGHIVKTGFDLDLFVGNPLVTFYGKCQAADSSRRVFDIMPEKDIVSWNSMISAYVTSRLPNEALQLFHVMLDDGTISPDNATLVGILPACAQVSAIKEGLWIHSYILKSGMELDAALGSGLISMYASSGRLKTAKVIFDQISDKNIVVWNTMIKAYGTHGHADKALKLFTQLLETGLRPDGIIFLCLLSACSHAGMVSEGSELFEKMEQYDVEKNHEHYACMIDLYSRSGLINKAMEFLETMPVQAGKDAYGALLGACRIHNNIELAELAAKKLFDLDPGNAGRYLILIKMYEDAGRYEDAARLREMLQEKNIRRPVGHSKIEVDYTFHTFGAEDESHPFKEQIFDTLHKLEMVMEDEEMTADQLC